MCRRMRPGRVDAEGDCELAVCAAPAKGGKPARLIPPEEVGQETRGQGHEHPPRPQHPAGHRAGREPAGGRGDHARRPLVQLSAAQARRDDLPHETYLEETYYHRLDPPQGFAVQRVYTDDRSLDETMAVEDGDVVLVPQGYHPVGAPHGYRPLVSQRHGRPGAALEVHHGPRACVPDLLSSRALTRPSRRGILPAPLYESV